MNMAYSYAVQALRSLKSYVNPAKGEHVHHFVDDEDCPCGRTFDQAVRTETDKFLLEINPEDP